MEIAEIMGMPVNTVKKRIFIAREKLRQSAKTKGLLS